MKGRTKTIFGVNNYSDHLDKREETVLRWCKDIIALLSKGVPSRLAC